MGKAMAMKEGGWGKDWEKITGQEMPGEVQGEIRVLKE